MNQPPPVDPIEHFLKKPTRFNAGGLGEVTLMARDDSRAGGMGCVYFDTVQGRPCAFKIYHDRKQAVQDNLPTRLEFLTTLKHENIIGPRGLIHDLKGEFVGYWMPTVQGEELSRLLTLQFQSSKGYSIDALKKLIEKMRDITLFAHDHGAIKGDDNERNHIFRHVPRKGLFADDLDVDNWGRRGKWGPVAIAPHIQNHHHKGPLNELTDHYALGILASWIILCTHPFGGRMSGFDHRDPEHLIKRMQAKAPLFLPGVKMPPATRDLSDLPGPFLDWCGRVYIHGEELPMPSMFDTTPVAAAAVTTHTAVNGNGHTRLLDIAGDPFLRIFGCGLALTRSGKLVQISSGKVMYAVQSASCEVVKDGNYYLIGDYVDEAPNFVCVEAGTGTQIQVSNQYAGDKIWMRDNRLYIITESSVSELKLRVTGTIAVLAASSTWSLMTKTFTWLDEVAVQNIMGQAHVWVPFAEGTYTVLRVKELDGLTPVASRASGKYAVITAQGRAGRSVKVEIKFDSTFGTCQIKSEATPFLALNQTILENGWLVKLEDSGELNISIPFTASGETKKDARIHTGMQLSSTGNKILYLLNGAVWHLKVG